MTDTNGDPGKVKGTSGKRVWPLFMGLPLIILIAVAAVAFSGGGERASLEQQSGEKGAAEQPSRAAGRVQERASSGDGELGHPALGEAGAPVVMIEYGDYQ